MCFDKYCDLRLPPIHSTAALNKDGNHDKRNRKETRSNSRMINWPFHHTKEENTTKIVQDFNHAPINLAAFPRSPEPALDENARDSNIIQLHAGQHLIYCHIIP